MRKSIILLLAILSLMGCGDSGSSSSSDTKKVNEVIDAYINVFVDKEEEIFDKIISPAPDIVVYSFGKQTLKGLKGIKKGIAKSIEKVEDSDLDTRERNVTVDGENAWFSLKADWNYNWDTQRIEVKGLRMTGVLKKIDGDWKIVQWHTSVPQ